MNPGTLASGFWDNSNLDEWEIPFGLWIEEIVFWLTTHIRGFLEAVKWPVDQLLELIIDNLLQDWLPWPVVLLLFFLLGVTTRNFLVGLGSAAGLLVCGLLGNEYWDLTMETIGMIIVAVIICTAVGIPLGILAARIDAFWTRLRPVLDGMQVIHPFVYLLPIIFLFGVRRTPGVLATLVFALPPIVRLTNLGIRQVPADVVEAARAFGATETRILREVQMPLARPAIMAGLNQTLLLSLSMVGIVAIIAGGGLGKPILTALNTADIPIGASAGAGLYFVGVLLDRISQPENGRDRRSLFARIRVAWSTRADPAVPAVPGLQAEPETPVVAAVPAVPELTGSHRLGAVTVLTGGLLAAFASLLTWGNDAGLLSGYARFGDTDLPGAHSGVDATGGSWFGIVLALVGLTVAFGGASALWRPRSRERFIASGGAYLAAGLVSASLAVAYLTVSPRGDNYSHGTGVWLALAGALIVLVGGGWTTLRERHDGTADPRGHTRDCEHGRAGPVPCLRRSVGILDPGPAQRRRPDRRRAGGRGRGSRPGRPGRRGAGRGPGRDPPRCRAWPGYQRAEDRLHHPRSHGGDHGGRAGPARSPAYRPAPPRPHDIRAGMRHRCDRCGLDRHLRPVGHPGPHTRRQLLPGSHRRLDHRRYGLASQQPALTRPFTGQKRDVAIAFLV